MKYILITGSAGLIGSECSEFFVKKGFKVLGLDNDSRKKFFGASGSTNTRMSALEKNQEISNLICGLLNKNPAGLISVSISLAFVMCPREKLGSEPNKNSTG